MGTVYGHVTVNGQPQGGATLFGGLSTATTDDSGYYEMSAAKNVQMKITALYNNYSANSGMFTMDTDRKQVDLNIEMPVTPTPTATPTPTPTPTPSPSATPEPSVTLTPTPTITPTPTATQAPTTAPVSTPQTIYVTVTVTVTPAPSATVTSNLTMREMISLNDTHTPTLSPSPSPSPTKTQSPGFAALLALACLAGAALIMTGKKGR